MSESTRVSSKSDGPTLDVESLPQWQRDRRQGIVDAARGHLDHSAFEDIQIRDVARSADVALGTLYRYFPSKEQLYAYVLRAWIVGHLEAPPAGAKSARDRLQWRMDVVISAYARQPHFLDLHRRILLSENAHVREALGDVLEASKAWTKSDLAVLGPDRADELGNILLAVVEAATVRVVGGGGSSSAFAMARTFVDLIADELATAERGAGRTGWAR